MNNGFLFVGNPLGLQNRAWKHVMFARHRLSSWSGVCWHQLNIILYMHLLHQLLKTPQYIYILHLCISFLIPFMETPHVVKQSPGWSRCPLGGRPPCSVSEARSSSNCLRTRTTSSLSLSHHLLDLILITWVAFLATYKEGWFNESSLFHVF